MFRNVAETADYLVKAGGKAEFIYVIIERFESVFNATLAIQVVFKHPDSGLVTRNSGVHHPAFSRVLPVKQSKLFVDC